MWTEFLKIKPQLSTADVNSMANSLSKRFLGVAKTFGSGLKNALLGGGVIGAVSAILNKILNPLKDTEEALNAFLARTDDIATNAKQFETTPGKLARLQSFGVSAGLSPQETNTMVGKFQVALAEARAEKNDPNIEPKDKKQFNLLKDFVDIEDTAEAYFQFIQALQKVDKDTQILAQKQVFGEKLILKQADFISQNFEQLSKEFSGISTAALTQSILFGEGLADRTDLLTAKRGEADLIKKGSIVPEQAPELFNKAAQNKLNTENERLANFEYLKKGAISAQQISDRIENLIILIGTKVPLIIDSINNFAGYTSNGASALSRISDSIKNLQISNALKEIFTKKGSL